MFLEISLGSGPAPIVGVEPGCGSPAWIRTTIHGSKGRCPTIRRPGNLETLAAELIRVYHALAKKLSGPTNRIHPIRAPIR